MAVLVLFLALFLHCNSDGGNGVGPPPPPPPPPPPSPPPPGTSPALREVASGFSAPLYLTSPPGDSRLFVVEQGGRIKIIRNGQVLATPFLDVSNDLSTGGERGLLSLAFHPDYSSNGRFFIYFTAGNGDLRVVEYRVSADPDRAVPNAVRTILSVEHRRSNHNGGLLLFGPDRKLYAGLGDGGGAGDPDENGQDRNVLLGKLLRLDMDAGVPYAIPPDNPFAGQAEARGEIWALGLRNPWRYSFDRQTGDLYIADVGQADFEEVNAAPGSPGGLNYGWDLMEGLHCFEPSSGCNRSGLTLPVLEYSHDDGCSVTGGYVYRGSAVPSLRGTYFYSDFCTGFVRSFRLAGGTATDQRSWPDLEADLGAANVTSFGEDSDGELYIVTSGGRIFEFVAE